MKYVKNNFLALAVLAATFLGKKLEKQYYFHSILQAYILIVWLMVLLNF